MANTNVYRTVKDVFDGRESYAVYASSGLPYQGDLCQWDPGALVATQMTTGSGAIFLGVSEESQPLAGLGTTARPLTGNMVRIVSQGLFDLNTTAGETYQHLTAVGMGADAQTVSTSIAGKMIGRCHLPLGTTVTGAAGTTVRVRIFGSMTNAGRLPSSDPTQR